MQIVNQSIHIGPDGNPPADDTSYCKESMPLRATFAAAALGDPSSCAVGGTESPVRQSNLLARRALPIGYHSVAER